MQGNRTKGYASVQSKTGWREAVLRAGYVFRLWRNEAIFPLLSYCFVLPVFPGQAGAGVRLCLPLPSVRLSLSHTNCSTSYRLQIQSISTGKALIGPVGEGMHRTRWAGVSKTSKPVGWEAGRFQSGRHRRTPAPACAMPRQGRRCSATRETTSFRQRRKP